MSGFVPHNGPFIAGIVVAPGTASMALIGCINQSHNASINYFNRNASSETTDDTILKSYLGAVSAAMIVTVGLSQLILRRYPTHAHRLLKCVALPSCLASSSINCFIMRSPELAEGWSLLDSQGHIVADGMKSIAAAQQGIFDTIKTRWCLSTSIFLGPSIILNTPPFLALSAPALLIASSFVTVSFFGFGLPVASALFPQYGSIDVSLLELEFQQLVDSGGMPMKLVHYNRGL